MLAFFQTRIAGANKMMSSTTEWVGPPCLNVGSSSKSTSGSIEIAKTSGRLRLVLSVFEKSLLAK
jgi:hypothetical protein